MSQTKLAKELRYFARLGWVKAKDLAGLPRRGDRTFYIDQFARKLKSGEIGAKVGVTVRGRSDGAGSQAQAVMSAICFASAFGLDYVHTPFSSIEHAEGAMHDWVRSWESMFNFGALGPPAGRRAVLPLGDFLRQPNFWSSDCVVAMPHYLRWCNQNTAAYDEVAPSLRKSFFRDQSPERGREIVVAVHVRRGDISQSNAGSYTANSAVISLLVNLTRLLSQRSEPFRVRLFSQGASEDFADIAASGCELNINESALTTFRALAEADIFVMAKSSFSYAAAILNQGVKIYEPYRQTRPLPDWLLRLPDGRFDEQGLLRRLDARKTSVQGVG